MDLVLVYDAKAPPSLAELPANWRLSSVHIDCTGASAVQAAGVLIVDVDLRDRAKIMRLREVLAWRAGDSVLVFAVGHGFASHLERVQANALGAQAVLSRPLELDALCTTLRDIGALQIAVADPQAAPSVDAGAVLLRDLFKSVTHGAPLDLNAAAQVGQELLSGVHAAGAASWLDTVRAHHSGTFQHCLLVTGAAAAWALEAGLPATDRQLLVAAALLHDIGKANIPQSILDKPGKLNERELAIIRRHPLIGRDYLLTQPGVPTEIITAVTHHHELLDGSGYPSRLRGEQIPLLTRILTVCDIYGALVEQRSYKPPRSPSEAMLHLVEMARQGQLDFAIVRTLGAAVGIPLRSDLLQIVGTSAVPSA